MSDENQTPPGDGGASGAPEPTYSAADVERILAADREERASAAPAEDPVARFRATAHGSKLYAKAKPQPAQPQQQQGTRLESLVENMLALQIAAMKPPAPPAPPPRMSVADKLASSDAAVWLKRGNPNEFTAEDRAELVASHADALRKSGFKGNIDEEAHVRARNEIVDAGRKALANIKLVPDGMHIPGKR